MSVVVADLIARLRADTTQFSSAIAGAQTQVATTSKGIGSSMAAMGKSIGVGFAIMAVQDFVQGALKEAEEAQRVAAQTAAVLKSTGSVAGVTAKQVEKYATKLSRLAAISDETVQSSENMLLTFKNIGGDTFFRAEKAIVNTAAGMAALHNTEVDLAATTLQVGKALNDPIKGMAALGRVGIQFSDSQKQNIADMMAFGNIAGAQKIILKELESQFGGSAAAGVTASQRLGVAWKEFQETVGKLILPVLEKITPILQSIVQWLADNAGVIKAYVAAIAAPFLVFYGIIIGIIKAIEKVGSLIGSLNPFANGNATRNNITGIPGGTPLYPSIAGKRGGKRARGGPVSAGSSYLVGERGPEMFTPNMAGGITPNGMGGGGVTVIVHGDVVTEGQLIRKIHEGLLAKQRKGGSLGFI